MHFFRLVFPPYLPIICPRLICIFSDIYLLGYAIPSLGSLDIGYVLLLGEPGISSGGGNYGASVAIPLYFLSAPFTVLYSVQYSSSPCPCLP